MTRLLLPLAWFALLSGCAVGPLYRQPAVLTGDAPAPVLIQTAEPPFDPVAPPSTRWWRLYDDVVLDGLVEKALVRNADLRVALAALEAVRASLDAAENKLWPETTLSVNVSRGKVSVDGVSSISTIKDTSYSGTEKITWDLDVFGKLRAAVAESKANVEAVEAALDLARVSVAAQVATDYSNACAANEQLRLADRSIALAQTKLDVTRRQFQAGVTDITSVVKAETAVYQMAAMKPSYVTQQRTALFNLATLTGDPPEAFPVAVIACARPPVLRRPIAVGDGASLIARRPDIRAAERRLAASIADIDASTAELYPSIEIGAIGGRVKTSLDGGSTTRINIFSYGALIDWSFPNFGAARAAIAASNASAKSALVLFDNAVLTALRETETALVKLARELDTERELGAARDGAAASRANTDVKYVGGLGKISEVLDAEQTLLSAETMLANASAQVSKQQVTLFKALGGGWQDAPPIAETSLSPVIAGKGLRWRWKKPEEEKR